jgi:GT2 family glycosyltransferase
MVISTPERTTPSDEVRVPSVLVVLVAHDGAAWLRDCLQSLAAQTHPRLGVLAVDIASTDGSDALLRQALGDARVLSVERHAGMAGAVRTALDLPAAHAADYVLILHDDAALGADAVARMIEAAQGIQGVERVGVVGPKVVDWDDPKILLDVGDSADRFGHVYSPLQDGEMDQGQYDRVLEVLSVSSCAMLMSREAWQRTGAFDERLEGHHDDLDFCWRARVAGFRVLMTPLAQVRHRDARTTGARDDGERDDGERDHGERHGSQYYGERAALAAMLKNYGFLSLAWLLPLHLLFGFVRLAYLTLSRRFEDAYELLSAWTWNLVHLPSTLRRRIRAQSVRATRDGTIRRFMQSAMIRSPRWFQQAEAIFEEQVEDEREQVPVRARARSLAIEHPVLVGWVVGVAAVLLAYRVLTSTPVLEGGALASFPSSPASYFTELFSAVRTTGLGGTQAASPALALVGALAWLPGVGGSIVQKLLLAVLPPLAALVVYRGLARQTVDRVAAVVAAVALGLSALVFWAFSEGRIPLLVGLVVLAAMFDRVDLSFGERPASPIRFVIAIGAVVAIGVAFLPGVLLGIAVLLVAALVSGPRRVRGLLTALAGVMVGAALVFPLVPDLAGGPDALGSWVGAADLARLGRLAPGGGPGTWLVAWFVPLSATIAFSLVGPSMRRRAWRGVVAAVLGTFLAWASAAGWLPPALANAPVYVAVAALAEVAVIAYGVATIGAGIERHAFGYRQIAVAALAGVLVLGGAGQLLQATLGGWAIGANGLPSAWPVVANTTDGGRVLWLGDPEPGRFPAPGGDPIGVVQAGAASVRFGLTDAAGVSVLDLARADDGPGYDYARAAIEELLAGGTSHAGAILAPLGVTYVVAGAGDLPSATRARLDGQLDLDLVPAGGLVIYRNARALPTAFVTTDETFSRAAGGRGLLAVAALDRPQTTAIRAAGDAWRGSSQGGFGYVADQDAGAWHVESSGRSSSTAPAFGWAIGFRAPSGSFSLVHDGQQVRAAELLLLGILWLGVVWVTRRPGSR